MTTSTMLAALTSTFEAAGDPEQAARMSAYMRDQFAFLGIPSPARRTLGRVVWRELPKPTGAELEAVARACWALKEREYHYFCTDYVTRHIRVAGPEFLDTVRFLLVTHSWWDTVDALASHVVGPLVTASPELVATMDAWAGGENLWLARTAVLHQLGYKARTDAVRLFGYCSDLAGHKDFFIRKAIGWALREYAYTEPELVRGFVEARRGVLSPLSVREALKNL
ncbi:DNA alkylation repair protein [Longispora fulva]|uniref:3-methyladenine DNA glycosylase AlkD n=1 Tax=Longispora fulva TaxID=619741 RepID=A0A8J7H4H5_9ACTN|nr:DNA alkylation repair protein [Longispora fulva]MBG6141328.1 3-methyladenine DNA glycosylase AlkD [Longispora fulva]